VFVLRRTGGARAAVLVALLLAADLGRSAWRFNPFPPQVAEPFPTTPGLDLLAARQGRVAVLGSEWLLPPPPASLHGVRLLHGVAPLLSARTAELLACVEGPLHDPGDPRVVRPFRERASLGHPLLDLLEVTTVAHADPGLAAAVGRANLYESPAEGLALLERPGAGPRAFLSGGAVVRPDRPARLALLARRDRHPHRSTVLEREPGPALPAEGPWQPAEVLEDRPGLVRLRTTAPHAGVLVLTESWAPGWTVTRDGRPAELLVANHALLGVAVEAGTHEVVFRHDGPVDALGAGLCGAAALAVLALAGGAARRARQTSVSATR